MPSANARIWLGALDRPGAEARHSALLDFCAASLGVAPQRLALTFSDFGAPLLLLDGAASAWRISSASRAKICLFGLARAPIGVDLELLGVPQEPAWNILHPNEQAALRVLPPDEGHAAFVQLWTAKEAYLKALGLGLRREPSEILVRPRGGAFRLFDRAGEVPTQEARLWREKIGSQVSLCACVVLAENSTG